MQLSQIFTFFALAVVATAAAIPQTAPFDYTLAKIKLAHPGISDEAAHASAVGFLNAVEQLQVRDHETGDIERRHNCCPRCKSCAAAVFTIGICCADAPH